MIDVEVTVTDRSGVLGAIAGLRRQIPYALATALNATVNDAQKAIQDSLPSNFILRHEKFIKQTIYRSRADFAKKDRLVAAVRVNPARDFLAKFETDTVKVGEHAMPVPVPLQNRPKAVIGRGDPRRFGRVMALIENQGGKAVGPFKKRGQRRAQQQSFFILHSRKGQTLVMQRDAGTVRVLFAFEHSVPIDRHRLHFEETALATALERWPINAEEAIAKAIATMR